MLIVCVLLLIMQGMTELPDFKKIEFPATPAIPLKDIVPDAPPEVGPSTIQLFFYSIAFKNNRQWI